MNNLLTSAIAVTLLPTLPTLALPAFPGAEGFGANALGGRGGDVYHVTTLAPDPTHSIPGSLFYGLYEKNVPAAGRTIVFDVGGTIDLGPSSLDIKNISRVTIAGQTAPSPITIINNTTQVTSSSGKETSNIILQYLTFRKGTGDGDDAFHIQGSGNTHDILIDHVSGSWSEDEVISSTQNATNVTVQNSIMSEALTSSHAYGSLVRPTLNANVSFLRNLYSNQKSRNPRPGTYDDATLNFEFQNNVIYNWSDRAGYIAGADGNTQHLNMNYVGNYLIAGPMALNTSANPYRRDTAFLEELSSSTGSLLDLHIFQQNNKIDSNANTLRDGTDTGWNMFHTLQTNGTYNPYTESEKSASPFPFPAYPSADPADVAYAKVISSVGAFPYARSTTDQRLINDVLNYTGTAPITAPNAAEWSAITTAPMTSRPANFDTDRDGMPNTWETLRGFNPNASDNNTLLPDGYTRLETYLHALTAIAAWNTDADATWSDPLNWRGTRPNSPDATALLGATLSAPRTITLDTPATTGSLTFDSPHAYTLTGSPLTLDVTTGSATLTANTGSHAISSPVTLSDNTTANVAAGATLSLTTSLTGPSATLTKSTGTGTLRLAPFTLSSLTITAGTVQLIPDAPTASKLTTLSPTTGALDLTNNALAIDYTTTSPANTIRIRLNQGRTPAGTWTATSGILSSTAANDPQKITAIGYIEASLLSPEAASLLAGGLSLDSTTLLLKYTYYGDANLDGVVNADDYALLDRGFRKRSTGWTNGDFNYDNTVDSNDYLLIDRAYLLTTRTQNLTPDFLSQRESQFGATYVSTLLSTVPEPSSLFAACGLAIPLTLNRKRT